MLGWTIWLAITSLGCSNEFNTNDTEVPEDTGRDDTVDTTPEDTEETDTRLPDDSESDTTPGFCDEDLSALMVAPGSAGLGACISEEIFAPRTNASAPVVIEGTNAGGSTHFTKEMYSAWHCASTEASSAHYDGPERVYFLYQPAGSELWVKFGKECHRNLEMRILRHAENDTCANENNNLIFCERDASSGTSGDQLVKLVTTTNPQFWSIVIDGRNDTVANYTLELECMMGECR
jgi:hypothetical protein